MRHLQRSCILALLSLTLVNALSAQDREKNGPQILRADAEGTHFIVGFMQNEENTSLCAQLGDRAPSEQQLQLASRLETSVTIIYPSGLSVTRQLSPFQINTVTLNSDQYECLGEGICDKSVEIISEEPISVYGFSGKPQTSDGYMALPISAWGTEYVTANYSLDYYGADPTRDPDNCNTTPRGGEFAVIAAEDNTTVTLYPATATASGGIANQPRVRTLQKGDIWQVQDGGTVRGATDLTGSRILADKPVGVLSGHVRTAIPWSEETKDHLVEMLPPTSGLGRRHVIVPFSGRKGGDMVRIISAEAGSATFSVTTASTSTEYTLTGIGAFKELLITEVSTIESEQAVLVAHYSRSNGTDLSSNFDPYMIVTTPEEQFTRSAIFQTMPNGPANGTTGKRKFERHFVTIVAERESESSLEIDHEPFFGNHAIVASGDVPGLNGRYVWATMFLPNQETFSITGDALFSGYVYGIGEYDSYGWAIGASREDVVVDQTAPRLTTTLTCQGHAYKVLIADDDKKTDEGISFAHLISSTSSNVQLDSSQPISVGSRTASVDILLVDPNRQGTAVLVAQDLAGNADTVILELQPNPPAFSHNSVNVASLPLNTLHKEPITITNSGTQVIILESVELASGVVVGIEGFGKEGIIGKSLNPGESYALSLNIEASMYDTYQDMLVLNADCYSYTLPITVTPTRPSITIGAIAFGQVLIEDKACKEFPIINNGTENLIITDIQIAAPFTIDPSSQPVLPLILTIGEQVNLIICYEPQQLGSQTGTILVVTNIGTSSGTLTGTGVDVITSVSDPIRAGEASLSVLQQGNSIVIQSSDGTLSMKGIEFVAINGERIAIGEVRREGTGRWRLSLPEGLPSGTYYLRAEGKNGEPISVKMVIVR